MYITKKEVETISKFYRDVMASGYHNNKGLAIEVHATLISLYNRRKETNAKQYARIKESRKTNPNYARPLSEWHKEDREKVVTHND